MIAVEEGAEESRTIVFVEKKFTAEALCHLLTKYVRLEYFGIY